MFKGSFEPIKTFRASSLDVNDTDTSGSGLLDHRMHVLTARVRDHTLDSAVVRLVNTASAEGVSVNLASFFSGMKLQDWKEETLALSYAKQKAEDSTATPTPSRHIVIPGQSVKTFTAMFHNAQPMDHVAESMLPAIDAPDKLPDGHGGLSGDASTAGIKADEAWLKGQSLSM